MRRIAFIWPLCRACLERSASVSILFAFAGEIFAMLPLRGFHP
jgi:hypothetical protein